MGGDRRDAADTRIGGIDRRRLDDRVWQRDHCQAFA
jgi:hypothetical protein